MQREETHFKVEIPALGSLIPEHSLIEPISVLEDFPSEDWPNSTVVFWLFRVMAGLGMPMILVSARSLWLRRRGQDKLFNSKALPHPALLVRPSGLIVILAGRFTIEMDHWLRVVCGLTCATDASSAQSVTQMSLTLLVFVVVHFLLLGVGIGHMMRLVRKDPVTHEGHEISPGGAGQKRTLARPLSAVGEGLDEEHDGHAQAADRDQDKRNRGTGIDLPLTWVIIIIFGIMMYVVMDDFDLGIGMLYPFFKDSGDCDVMMNTVAPVWDGNETWLVPGGATLFGAFPLAYATVLPAFYLPLASMLVGLIFRGVVFEFRFKAKPAKQHIWDKVFIGGSLVATFSQGMALGVFTEGISVEDRSFASGSLDWTVPFPLPCSLALIAVHTPLGCTWLIMETEGRLQECTHDLVHPLALVLLAIIGVASLWMPLAHAEIAARWFSPPNLFWFLSVPISALVTFYMLLRSMVNNDHVKSLVLTLMLISFGYSGLGISLWPNIILSAVSIWEASASPQSQGFMLVDALFIIPFIPGYIAWSYYVFRGKVKHGDGHH